MPESSIPKMRTVAKTVDELKRLDPDTCVSAYYIRQLIKKGRAACRLGRQPSPNKS